MAQDYEEFKKQFLELKNLYEKEFIQLSNKYDKLVETATKKVAGIKPRPTKEQEKTFNDFMKKFLELKKFEKEMDKYLGSGISANMRMMATYFNAALRGSKYLTQAEKKKQEIENKIAEIDKNIAEIEKFLESIKS